MAAPRIGFALGSGIARGWAHIGVLRALAAAGIAPAVIAGTSMGALVGGAALAGRLDGLESFARRLTLLRVMSYLDLQLGRPGVIAGERLLETLDAQLGGLAVEDLPLPFAAIATDLATGEEIWLRRGRLLDALRASFSLPGILPPARIEGRWLVDGAMVNPVPVAACRALGADLVVAVDLQSDLAGRSRGAGSRLRARGLDLLAELPGGARAVLLDLAGRHVDRPSLLGVMAQSLAIAAARLSRSQRGDAPADLLISPRLGHVGLLEFHRAAEAIAEGRAAAERALPDLVARLEEAHAPA
jgi:NTE family protein